MESAGLKTDDGSRQPDSSGSGADDYRMLLTVIAGISLGVAATAIPVLVQGPFLDWMYAATLVMWLTGVAAGILEYLAVSFGSRLYLTRVEVFATSSLAFVFLAQAGMFVVLGMGKELLGPRWFVLFALFNIIAGLEANHGRRMVLRHAPGRFDREVVHAYAKSLRQVIALVLATALCSLLFVALWSDAPPLAVFLGSCAALAATVLANVQQQGIRNRLALYGVFPGSPRIHARSVAQPAPSGDAT